MSAEPPPEPSPPSFPEGPHPWAGCQNFTLIWCSLGPELLTLLQRRVRKCAIYLITMNSWHFLALNCCLYTHNCLAKYKATVLGAPPDRKHAFGHQQGWAWGAFARTFTGAKALLLHHRDQACWPTAVFHPDFLHTRPPFVPFPNLGSMIFYCCFLFFPKKLHLYINYMYLPPK